MLKSRIIIAILCLLPLTIQFTQAQPLQPEVRAVGVFNTIESEEIPLVIEEFLETRYQPLLPYVFFTKNSDAIPERYAKLTSEETQTFATKDLFGEETLNVYYHIMNIIGERLRKQFKDANITLTGCTDGKETEGISLSRRRAESVKKYFIDVWNIEESRILINTVTLPEKPTTSSGSDEESNEENRRVEISSDNNYLIAPVLLESKSYRANPPVVRFYINVEPKGMQKSWELTIAQGDKELVDFPGTAMPSHKDWEVLGDPKKLPKLQEPIVYKFSVTDAQAKVYSTKEQYFKVVQITTQEKKLKQMNDTLFDKYSLILFNFDKWELSGEHKEILDFVKERITADASIQIDGYADRLGDSKYNLTLSEKRANSVKDFLDLVDQDIKTIPHGEFKALYNCNLPEGRAYSRTVDITAKIPMNYDK